MIKFLVAAGFLAMNFYAYHFFATEEVRPSRAPFLVFPAEIDGWKCPEFQTMDEKTEKNLGVTDYLLCNYENRERQAYGNVYIGYHASQVRKEGGGSGENSIHPPKHCLPGSGWDIIEADTRPLDLPGFPPNAKVNRFVIAKGEMRSLVYYWYQSRGQVIAEDWEKIVRMFWDRATRRRTDGSLVRFTVPILRGEVEEAEANFRSLASGVVPKLADYVPE